MYEDIFELVTIAARKRNLKESTSAIQKTEWTAIPFLQTVLLTF